MMIVPPTGSPSTIEMALAARRIEDKGIGKKAEETDQGGEARLSHQAVWAMETQSLFRLGGSQSGRSCFEAGRAGPRRGISQKRSSVLSGFLMRSLSLEFYMPFGPGTPAHADRCGLPPDCTADARCLGIGSSHLDGRGESVKSNWADSSRLPRRSKCSNCRVLCRFCTLRQWNPLVRQRPVGQQSPCSSTCRFGPALAVM